MASGWAGEEDDGSRELLRVTRWAGASAMPVVPAVGAGRTLVIKEDAFSVLGTLPTPWSIHQWFPL